MDENDLPGVEAGAEDLLTIDEAAKFLDTSKSTIYRLLGGGDVKGTKVGKQWRFRKPDLLAYLQRTPETVSVAESARGELEAEIAHFDDLIGAPAGESESIEASTPQSQSHEAILVVTPSESAPGQLARRIIRLAIDSRASDIHIERISDVLRLRFRIDGMLHEIRRMPPAFADALIAKFKEMADMNVSERRLPQDGRLPILYGDREFDFRVSSLPVLQGEDIVMRILDRSSVLLGLERLGIAEDMLQPLRAVVRRPSGMVIASGPTGSGKTTLLYSILQEIATDGIKAVSIEDPVEYQLQNVSQAQVNRKAGMTYAMAMRAFMRQDPDIIYCAEMRDRDSAEIAIEAALTGHMLFTALHTEDAPSVITRLTDIGLEPYLVAATLNCAIAMRLVRRLCPECKTIASPQEIAPTVDKIRSLSHWGGYTIPERAVFFEPVGCPACRNTGYQGRFGLQEILFCNAKLVQDLMRCSSVEEKRQVAVDAGMRTLLADGISKAVAGETTIDEALRATGTWL